MNITVNSEQSSAEEVLCDKKNTAHKKIYLRSKRAFIEVTDEVYYAYYRPIWKIHDKEKRAGRCTCTKLDFWQCDGECLDCSYHSSPDIVSDSNPISETEDLSIADLITSTHHDPEKAFLFKELLSDLDQEFANLKPAEQKIFRYHLAGKTDREIASLMGRSLSTVNERKNKVLAKLGRILRDYMESGIF